MLMDSQLQFSANQAITATAASTYAYDMLSGKFTTTFSNPPVQIGNATYFGEDLGLGRGEGTPTITVTTGDADWGAGTSLQIAFQGAPDNVTAHATLARSDLTFVTYIETPTIALALLLANTNIAVFDWPVRKIGQVLPRFVQLLYTVVGSNFTTATLNADVTLGPNTAQGTMGQYPNNYA